MDENDTFEPEDDGLAACNSSVMEGCSMIEVFDIPQEAPFVAQQEDPVDEWGLGAADGPSKAQIKAAQREIADLEKILAGLQQSDRLLVPAEIAKIEAKLLCLHQNKWIKACPGGTKSLAQLRNLVDKAKKAATPPATGGGSGGMTQSQINKKNAADKEIDRLNDIIGRLSAAQKLLVPAELAAIRAKIECLQQNADKAKCNQAVKSYNQLRAIAVAAEKAGQPAGGGTTTGDTGTGTTTTTVDPKAFKAAQKEIKALNNILTKLSAAEEALMPEEIAAVTARIACLTEKADPKQCLQAVKTLQQLRKISKDKARASGTSIKDQIKAAKEQAKLDALQKKLDAAQAKKDAQVEFLAERDRLRKEKSLAIDEAKAQGKISDEEFKRIKEEIKRQEYLDKHGAVVVVDEAEGNVPPGTVENSGQFDQAAFQAWFESKYPQAAAESGAAGGGYSGGGGGGGGGYIYPEEAYGGGAPAGDGTGGSPGLIESESEEPSDFFTAPTVSEAETATTTTADDGTSTDSPGLIMMDEQSGMVVDEGDSSPGILQSFFGWLFAPMSAAPQDVAAADDGGVESAYYPISLEPEYNPEYDSDSMVA